MATLVRAKASDDVLAYRRAMHRAYTEWCVGARVQAATLFMTGHSLRGFAERLNESGFSIPEITEIAQFLADYADRNAGVRVDLNEVHAYLNGLRERWALRPAG